MKAHTCFVERAQLQRRGKQRERCRRRRDAGKAAVGDEEVAVTGKDKGDVQALPSGVALDLLHPVPRRQVLRFRFDEGQSHRLAIQRHAEAQRIVGAAPSPLACGPPDDLDSSGRLLTLNQVFGPSTRVQSGVNQLGARVGFIQAHR